MGLESINFELVTAKGHKFDAELFLSKIDGLERIESDADHPKYRVTAENFLIDLMILGRKISVRIALCNSIDSMAWLLKLSEDFLKVNIGHSALFETFTGQKFSDLNEINKLFLNNVFDAKKEIFLDYIGDISNFPASSDGLRAKLREINIKPRNPDKGTDIADIKKELLEKRSKPR